ncbi:MAG: DMT family transporter [Sediminibacterium sp.]|nr:DMT family transporter [Sediminibacterium sp.]
MYQMPTGNRRIGFWMAVTGALLFSTKAIWVKLAYRDTGVDAVSLLFIRMLFSLPFYVALFIYIQWKERETHHTNIRLWIGMIVMGLAGYYASSLFDFIGLQYVSAGLERLILFIYPTLAVLINSWWLKTRITKQQRWALVLTYTGIVLACYSELAMVRVKTGFYFGTFMILLCAITYAFYLVGTGKMVQKAGVIRYTSTVMLAATAGIGMHYAIVKGGNAFILSSPLAGYGIALALIATVIPSFLMSSGMKRIGSNQVSIITSIGPVSTILQAHWFLNEPIGIWQITGTGLVIIGVILISGKQPMPEEAVG